LFALYVAYLLGGVIAIALLVGGHVKRGAMLPMGTFLTVGTIVVMLVQAWQPDWLQWFVV
jgi:prepilin signal peptidase PulO-like enzyme (type II secretory pathway)